MRDCRSNSFIRGSFVDGARYPLCPFPFGDLRRTSPPFQSAEMGENMNMNFHKNKSFSLSKSDCKLLLCIPNSHSGFGEGRGGVITPLTSSPLPHTPRSYVVARAAFVRPKPRSVLITIIILFRGDCFATSWLATTFATLVFQENVPLPHTPPCNNTADFQHR